MQRSRRRPWALPPDARARPAQRGARGLVPAPGGGTGPHWTSRFQLLERTPGCPQASPEDCREAGSVGGQYCPQEPVTFTT